MYGSLRGPHTKTQTTRTKQQRYYRIHPRQRLSLRPPWQPPLQHQRLAKPLPLPLPSLRSPWLGYLALGLYKMKWCSNPVDRRIKSMRLLSYSRIRIINSIWFGVCFGSRRLSNDIQEETSQISSRQLTSFTIGAHTKIRAEYVTRFAPEVWVPSKVQGWSPPQSNITQQSAISGEQIRLGKAQGG